MDTIGYRKKPAKKKKERAQHLVFTNSAGLRIEEALFPQFEDPQFMVSESGQDKLLDIELANKELGLKIDSKTAITAWRGETMDYDMAVSALIHLSTSLGGVSAEAASKPKTNGHCNHLS